MQDEIDYLAKLVSFKTETQDKIELKKSAQYLSAFFESKNLHTEILTKNEYPNIVATSQKTKRPKIFLQAHMDVVPAKPEQYELREREGKLYGRGVFDMKFAVASYMKLLDLLEENIGKYDFGIMLTFDEEVGGMNGVDALLKDGYGSEAVILPDSGRNWMLENSAMGTWFLKLSKRGKNAHGSLPEKGVNSAEILAQALAEIVDIRKDFLPDDLTATLTVFNSGKAINQVPDYAEAILDIRYKNKAVLKKIDNKIEKISKKFELTSETHMLGGCVDVSTDDPLVKKFIDVTEDVIKREVKTGHSKGSTDGRYFCAQNIPCIVIQPDGGGRHSDEEWIDKNGIQDLTQILYRYITNNC
jgi:acetylornithine deacetylase/succinyl-diaminopimelate desuccinylase-like protein